MPFSVKIYTSNSVVKMLKIGIQKKSPDFD
jgi:hypothetical protein